MVATRLAIQRHQSALRECARCPAMVGRPVTGAPVSSPILLIGQAPGAREVEVHRPFAWTAGKTLFGWFGAIGLSEADFRSRVYMAAVCRCFPGKNPRGGDRVPNREEIAHCRHWLQQELQLLQPELLLPVGKLAIQQFLPVAKLDAVIGQVIPHLDPGDLDVVAETEDRHLVEVDVDRVRLRIDAGRDDGVLVDLDGDLAQVVQR